MKLRRIESKEIVHPGDIIYYRGESTMPYTFISITPAGFIIVGKYNTTLHMHPSTYKCEIVSELAQ